MTRLTKKERTDLYYKSIGMMVELMSMSREVRLFWELNKIKEELSDD